MAITVVTGTPNGIGLATAVTLPRAGPPSQSRQPLVHRFDALPEEMVETGSTSSSAE
jgi:hypothetical protein